MTDSTPIAEPFEAHRAHLRAVAYRMLGSLGEAEDAVQEAWLRLHRADAGGVENLRAWLTTVVARVCLDMLRARKSRREDSLDAQPAEPQSATSSTAPAARPDPEKEALLADSVGLAMLVVLDRLEPSERLAFVLHDMFAVPFAEIAAITGRSPAAARQLASRARRRVRGQDATTSAASAPPEQRALVERFLEALRAGDFEGLVAVLDPDVLVHLDASAGAGGAAREIRGARTWAQGAVAFARMARVVRPALVDGAPGLVLAPHGRLARALKVRIAGDRIVEVEIIADRERLRALSVAVLE